MKTFLKNNLLTILIFLLIPLAVGGLSALLSMPIAHTKLYETLTKPPLSPPAYVFPIVWTILYLLMGVSSYLIYKSGSADRSDALFNYGVQLFVNFFWPIIFFYFSAYFAALVWLVFLWILVFHMIQQFVEIRPVAGWLQIPYLTWLSFAAYLNFAIYLLNK